VLDDPEHPDSTAHFRLVGIPLLAMTVTFEDDHVFFFELPYDVYVVRGDAALRSAAASDSTRWFVRKIDDQSSAAPAGGPAALHDEALVTWGSLRGVYRD
jgi:hypothetical protein